MTAPHPAAAVANWRAAITELNTACPPNNAAHSLNYLLDRLGSGAVQALARMIGRERQMIARYRRGTSPLSTDMVLRIAGAYAADPMPRDSAQLDQLLQRDIPGQEELFALLYSPDETDAASWLITNRGHNFRWTELGDAQVA